MVAKIVHSKNIRAILNYNENKIREREAELLLAAGYPMSHEELNFRGKLERFLKLTRENERTQTNAMHIILSFSPRDKLDNDVLQSIALQYMEGIGFGGQPFLLYRHYDTYNPHVHIATVNIAAGGQRIETHNIGRNQSEKARKLIEELYGLVRAEDQPKEMESLILPAALQRVAHGKSATKAAVSAIVRQVTATYKFTSLPELNAALRQFNVMAYRGPEDSRMYEKGGLVYGILGEGGEPASIPIKASSIYGSPTLKNLEKKYGPNAAERKPYGERLKHQVDKALSGRPALAEIAGRLKKKGIRILLRLNEQGDVYGATFIDNATRTVFKGSDLGKSYAAKGFMEKLSGLGISLGDLSGERDEQDWAVTTPITDAGMPENQLRKIAKEPPVIELIQDDQVGEDIESMGRGLDKRKVKRLGME